MSAPPNRPLAYVLGWMTHLVGRRPDQVGLAGRDAELARRQIHAKKSSYPGSVHLPRRSDGRNCDSTGRLCWRMSRRLRSNQFNCTICGLASPRGRLAQDFPEGWVPAATGLLQAVARRESTILEALQGTGPPRDAAGANWRRWQCRDELRLATGGLSYAQMIEAAEQAATSDRLSGKSPRRSQTFGRRVRLVPIRRCPRPQAAWHGLTSGGCHRDVAEVWAALCRGLPDRGTVRPSGPQRSRSDGPTAWLGRRSTTARAVPGHITNA